MRMDKLADLDPTMSMPRTVEALKEALERIPLEEGAALSLTGDQERLLGLVVDKVDEAEGYFDRPVDDPGIYERLVAIGRASGRGDLVDRFGRKAAEIEASDLEFKARLQAFFGASSRAADLFYRALELNPDFPEAADGVGKAVRRMDKAKGNLAKLKGATDATQGSAKAWLDLGQALADLDEIEKALSCFNNAVKLAPEDPNALVRKGGALAVMGDLEAAKECYEAALAIQPKSLNAKRGLNYTSYLLDRT